VLIDPFASSASGQVRSQFTETLTFTNATAGDLALDLLFAVTGTITAFAPENVFIQGLLNLSATTPFNLSHANGSLVNGSTTYFDYNGFVPWFFSASNFSPANPRRTP
jgi:hypothetical protein